MRTTTRITVAGGMALLLAGLLTVAGPSTANASPFLFFQETDLVIADQSTQESVISVPGSACQGPLNDVNVGIEYQHTASVDLNLTLRSPAGVDVRLMDDEGGSTDDGKALFDDEATLLVEGVNNNTAVNGWYVPEEPLSTLEGIDPTGDWTLLVDDQFAGDVGVLTEWSLQINCYDASIDFPFVNDVVVPIPDLGQASSSVSVASCDRVDDVDIDVVFQHSLISDLRFVLAHGGVEVTFWESGDVVVRRGGSLAFDDDLVSPKPIAGATAVVTIPGDAWALPYSTYTPSNPLAAFDGMGGTGQWTLTVTDTVAQDDGELQQFGLDLTCTDLPDAGPAPEPPGPAPEPPDPAPEPPAPAPEPPTPDPDPVDAVIPLFGPGRVQTAVAVSVASFPDDGSAASAVLATEGTFADALAGTPLAVTVDGPLLLTPAATLVADTAEELTRVLQAGATVHVLGGEAALSSTVAAAVSDLGFEVVRLSGPSRFETAVAIADLVHDLDPLSGVLVADGLAFQAALVAGTAAAQTDAALLLSNGDLAHPATVAFIADRPTLDLDTVGDVAADAHPDLEHLADLSEPAAMSVAVAASLGATGLAVGVANLVTFPDGLTGGAHIARLGGPLLLTAQETLSPAVEAFLAAGAGAIDTAFVYGGTAAVTTDVRDAVLDAITPVGTAVRWAGGDRAAGPSTPHTRCRTCLPAIDPPVTRHRDVPAPRLPPPDHR